VGGATTVEGVFDVAKGVFSIVMGGIVVIESDGLLWYAGVGEIAVGETEIAEGITILSTAPDPTSGVDYIPDPNADNIITLPTVEIGPPEPAVITTSEIIIYGTPPADVTPDNIITLPTIEISDLPENPPPDPPPGGEGDGGGGTP
jgi:hypothetical protein